MTVDNNCQCECWSTFTAFTKIHVSKLRSFPTLTSKIVIDTIMYDKKKSSMICKCLIYILSL